MKDTDWTKGDGGGAIIFFQASPGELKVEVQKQDLNTRDRKHGDLELRAILFAPDRRVIHDRIIPDDKMPIGAGTGPEQVITLSTQVDRPGLYGMMIMIINAPNGEDVVWRYRSNAPSMPIQDRQWFVTPYSLTVHGKPGDRKNVVFKLHNKNDKDITSDIMIEFPGAEWDAKIKNQPATVKANTSAELKIDFTIPEDAPKTVYLRFHPTDTPDMTSYVALNVRTDQAKAERTLRLPVELTPCARENELFGYLPDYPTNNQVYFDLDNKPFIRTAEGVMTLCDGKWISGGPRRNVNQPHAGPWTKIAFDKDNDVYLSDATRDGYALLRSTNGGQTFSTHPLPNEQKQTVPENELMKGDLEKKVTEIEVFSGHNLLDGPPPVMRYTRCEQDKNVYWRKYGNLELLIPKKTETGIEWEEPVLISNKSLGMSSHSGIPSTVVSCGPRMVHVTWCEAIDPDADKRMGTPAFAATYDRAAQQLSKPVFVGIGRPANDVHNTPSITLDSQGYLHVLTGAHGSHFYYAKSVEPNDTSRGFSVPVMMRDFISQTYIGMVCGPDDTLHVAFREWRHATKYFSNSNIAALSYLRKRPDEKWSEPKTMVIPPFSGYSVYAHRLTIDREGRLFLSYSYKTGYTICQTDTPEERRALMMSDDEGETWKLVNNTSMLVGKG